VCVFADGFDDLRGERVRRQDHGGIARVDTGELDVLQHPADDDGALGRVGKLADVREAIDIHFRGVLEEFVHQHRAFRGGFDGEAHVMLQFAIGKHDLHGAAA